MGAVKKKKAPAKKKLSPQEQAAQKAGQINDIDDDTYKFTLRKQARALEQQMKRQQEMAAMFQAQRHRANYFWIVAKKELQDKQADYRNKQRELQDLLEKHEIEIKVYQQRLKHLLFQNLDQLTQLKKEAELTLKNQEDEHRIDQRQPKYDSRALKIQKKEQEVRQKDYLRALEKTKMSQSTKIRQEYERETAEIKLRYNHKMDLLRKEMEDKRKKIISQIENKKNLAIKQLTNKHAKKYQKIKLYYQEINNTNFELIKQLKQDVNQLKKKQKDDLKMLYQAKVENEQYSQPLKQAVKDVERLKKEQIEYNIAKSQLQNTKQLILEQEVILKDIEWKYEVRLQQQKYLERQKAELFEHFNKVVNQVHQKTGLRNLIFEKKVETIKESIETKDAQLNQLLAAAKIDPKSVGVIKSTLEEVESTKNQAIKDIQYEMKKIRQAHSNMVKTYEGKLSEFGIPVEELGFDPLVPANV